MGSRTVIRRLERLEQISRADGGVSILELLPSGEWELMMGGKRSIHPSLGIRLQLPHQADQSAHKGGVLQLQSDKISAVVHLDFLPGAVDSDGIAHFVLLSKINDD